MSSIKTGLENEMKNCYCTNQLPTSRSINKKRNFTTSTVINAGWLTGSILSLQQMRWDVCCEVRGPGRTTKIDEKAQTNEQNQTRAALSAPPGVSRHLGCHSNRVTSSSHLQIWGRVREVFGLHVSEEQSGSASFIPMEKEEEALVEWASSFLLS